MTPFFGLVVNLFLMGIAIWSIYENIFISKTHLGQTKTSITRKGSIIIVCALGVVFFSYWKDCNYDRTQDADKEAARKKDSINKADIVKAVNDNSKQIAKALAEYNLGIEKRSDSILKIVRDSAKRSSIIINQAPAEPDPLFTLEMPEKGQPNNSIIVKEIRENVDSVYTRIGAYKNDVRNLTLYAFTLIPYMNDTLVIENLTGRNLLVMSNTTLTVKWVTHNPLHILDVFYLAYIGIYQNKKGEKFYMDEIYYVHPKTETYSRVAGFNIDNWKNFMIRKSAVAKKFYAKHKL